MALFGSFTQLTQNSTKRINPFVSFFLCIQFLLVLHGHAVITSRHNGQ